MQSTLTNMSTIEAQNAIETPEVAYELQEKIDRRTQTDIEKMKRAFQWKNDWRSIDGIARAAHVSEAQVKKIVELHPELFAASPFKFLGVQLYRLVH